MAGRTPYEAVESYRDLLRRVVSCVTDAVLYSPRGVRRLDEPTDLVLGAGEPIRLRGPEHLHLRVRLRFRVVRVDAPSGPFDTVTAAYEYRLSDQDDREILAYHWHPDGASRVQTPHLHLGPAAEVGRLALTTAHLPTGWVGLGAVIGLAIEDFRVPPIRRDWDAVIREAGTAPAQA